MNIEKYKIRLLRGIGKLKQGRNLVSCATIRHNKSALLEQLKNNPERTITISKPGARGIITNYRKNQVRRYGKVVVTGNNGTCIPGSIVNGVGELKRYAAAERSFCQIENMKKSCGEKLEFETLPSACPKSTNHLVGNGVPE